MLASLALAPLLLGLAPRPLPQETERLSMREAKALVAEYVATDWKSPEGIARHDEILERLALHAPLAPRDVKSWRKTITKAWEKGPELAKKGKNHLWEEEERGLYIVDGNTKKPKGLFLGMHGGGVGSGEATSSHGAFARAVDELDWVGIFPEVLEKTELGWTTSGTEEFVLELVERALRTWDIDRDKVFFGGHSMGGYGSWTLGAHHADTVAGLTPSAGAPTPYLSASGSIAGIVKGIIPNLHNVAMVIYQSTDDVQVPPDANQAAVRKLEQARKKWGGFDFEYWEVTDQGHGLPPGGTIALLRKIADRTRNARPERIVWQPDLSWKRQFYWLWWDAPQRHATVVADLKRDENAVDLSIQRGTTEGLWVLLDDELLDLSREVLVRVDGEVVYRGVPQRSLAALVSTARRGDERLTFEARVPAFETKGR